MERAIARFRAEGHTIDDGVSFSLRLQGFAMDQAQAKADPWQASNANRVYLELLQGYGLVRGRNADPLDALIQGILADDDTDDDHAQVPDPPD